MTNSVTPSSLWQGTAVADSRWTYEQLQVLDGAGVADPETVDTATVLRTLKVNAKDWTTPPEPVRHVLPRLALARRAPRAKVVTPAGAVLWLDVVPHG